jgi:phage gp29-like protein
MKKLSNTKTTNRKKATAPTVGAERVQAYIRSRFNPIRSLTPDLLSQYLDSFKTGYLRQCALVWDAIEERDYILSTVIPKRKAAAARHGWEILTLDSVNESQKKEAELHKQALETFYNNLTVTNAIDENERGEVSLLLRQMMSAVGYRYAIHEIVWRPGASPAANSLQPKAYSLSAELRFVPVWFFENTKGRLRYLQSEGSIEGVDMDEDSWMVSVAQGIMVACSVAYIYKNMSLKDWVIYNERHGMPGIHGKTDASKDSDEWDDLVTAVQNFAADWALVTNSGASIEKVDMAATGQLPYPPLVELMDRAMSALWRGADLSTMSGKTPEGGQGASLQGDESKTLEEDDAAWLSETLSRNLDRRVIEYTFGEGVQPLAYIKIKTAQKKDITNEITIDKFLLDAGAPVGVDNTLERYNRPLPDPDDELLKPPSVVSPQPSSFSSLSAPASPPGHSTGGDADLPLRQLSEASRTRAKMGNSNAAPIPAGLPSIAPGATEGLLTDRQLLASAEPLAKPGSTVDSQLVSTAVAETIGVRSEWLAPFFAALDAKAHDRSQSYSDSDLLDAIEAMARSLPELLSADKVTETAGIVQKLLTESISKPNES